MHATIYVRDARLWVRARKRAQLESRSLSELIARALKLYCDLPMDKETTDRLDRILTERSD